MTFNKIMDRSPQKCQDVKDKETEKWSQFRGD